MAKFQVVKCSEMVSKPGAPTSWVATMVKGLFTDDAGEVEMLEVMLFPERGQSRVEFKAGEQLQPVISVRRNKATQRPELVIASLIRPGVGSSRPAA